MIRVSDYIFRSLADYGVKHVFLVVGGGAMHLNDALKKEKRLKYVCHHHEQGAAIAAEGYARTSGGLAVVSVTSGPGGTNALTGVLGQWLDSVPVLYLSGQVKFETTVASLPDLPLRQLGDQETTIVDIVRPVTKYAKMIIDPQSVPQELRQAIRIAAQGRPGPVWLDIPLNVQGAMIADPGPFQTQSDHDLPELSEDSLSKVIDHLKKARRPVLVVGHGIRITQAQEELLTLVHALGIPAVTTFNGFDLIPSSDDFFVGRIGTLGSRAGNFALQNADLVICLGTRNNIRQVSYNWASFAKNASKIIVDIDEAELHKKTVRGDLLVRADVKDFIRRLLSAGPGDVKVDREWLDWCRQRREKYPVVLDEYRIPDQKGLHPYHFVEALTSALDDKALVVAANGTACVGLFQAGTVKSGQRYIWNSGCASMGYALPAAIGAACAAGREVICLTGDGSLQMNLQELQTVRHHGLPVKIFVLNNSGYRSIEITQTNFFAADFIGCNKESGVSFPDTSKLAEAYGFPYQRIDSAADMTRAIQDVLSAGGPVLAEVMLRKDYVFAPKVSSKKEADGRIISQPLENLYPFLDRDELLSNMLVRDEKEA